MQPWWRGSVATALLLATGAGSAWAQGIYTCVDAKGRRITSDRPIAECMDRPQQELNSTGTVRRVLPPSLTAEERAQAEERARQASEQRQREDEERRRNRALLSRYPNKDAHDRERAVSLRLVDDIINSGQKRLADLDEQLKKLLAEAEFYRKDPAKTPPRLKKQMEDLQLQIAGQKKLVSDQVEEKRRVNARFDEELGRLRQLWAQLTPAAARAASERR